MCKFLCLGLVALFGVTISGCDSGAKKATISSAESQDVSNDSVQFGESFTHNESSDSAQRSEPLAAFLVRFDAISNMGFVPTQRRGSTGVGYTLETMLGIKENNSPGGDFLGMEIKAFRDDDLTMDDSEKMNLFLKEPNWIDGLKASQRVRSYGYIDPNGRNALYSTVTVDVNSHKLSLSVDDQNSKLWLVFDGQRVACWNRDSIAKRLMEKHTSTVFVSAHAKGKGTAEQFHYYGVTWCSHPSVDEFLRLIETGDVMLELRMHLKESGATRNHGCCFRIKQNRLKDLFSISKQVRP